MNLLQIFFKERHSTKGYYHEVNDDHGRIETRQVKTLPVNMIDSQLDLNKWANIQSVVEIIYKTDNSLEKRYFTSTLNHKEVELIAKSIRSHWQIESAPQAHKTAAQEVLAELCKAVGKMVVGPPKSAIRSRLQTTSSGCH